MTLLRVANARCSRPLRFLSCCWRRGPLCSGSARLQRCRPLHPLHHQWWSARCQPAAANDRAANAAAAAAVAEGG